jgi:hypothetical protein
MGGGVSSGVGTIGSTRESLDTFVLRRAVSRDTITYAGLVCGMRPEGAT